MRRKKIVSNYRPAGASVPGVFTVFLALVVLAGCASFKGDIPVETRYPEQIYISPRNMDGIQDEVVVDL